METVLKYAKALVAGAGPLVMLLVQVYADRRFSAEEWGLLVTAILTAIGVGIVPNKHPARAEAAKTRKHFLGR